MFITLLGVAYTQKNCLMQLSIGVYEILWRGRIDVNQAYSPSLKLDFQLQRGQSISNETARRNSRWVVGVGVILMA